MILGEVAEALGKEEDWVEARVAEGLPFRFEEGVRHFSPPLVRDWLVERGYVAPEPAIVSSVKAVAEHFGVTTRSVQTWKDQGMPWSKDCFDLTAIAAWREAYKGNSQDRQELQERGALETKLAGVKLKKAQAELDEFLGKLIDVNGPKRVLVQTVNAIRTHLEQFPERLMELVNLDSDVKLEVRRAAAAGIEDLLRAIQQQLKAAGEELVPAEHEDPT